MEGDPRVSGVHVQMVCIDGKPDEHVYGVVNRKEAHNVKSTMK